MTTKCEICMTTKCAPCAFAAVHYWFGPDHKGAHCRDCHRSWTGLSEVHCHLCHEHFSAGSTADLAHPNWRSDGPSCVPPGSVFTKAGVARLRLAESINGPIWRQNGSYREHADA